MDKNFSLYLIKIGLFDQNISKEIIKPNKEFERKNFEDSSFHYLMNFFDNLNEEQKKYMSYYIPNNFKIITTQKKIKKLKSIFIQKILRQKLKLLKYFYNWKTNINSYESSLNNNNEENYKSNYDEIDKIISLDDYFSNEKKKINKYNYKNMRAISNIKKINDNMHFMAYKSKNERPFNKLKNKFIQNCAHNNNNYEIFGYKTMNMRKPDYKYIYRNLYQPNKSKKEPKNKLLTSLETKELKDLKECTFKPRINALSSKKKINKSQSKNKSKENLLSTFDRLYKDEEKNKLNKELKTIDREYTLGKNFSFTPNINNKFRHIYKYQDHKNFAQRQREYMEKIDKKKEDLKYLLESKNELICSFNPKITNEKGEYYPLKKKTSEKEMTSSSVFKRLYLDVMTRQNLKEQKEKENNDKFNEMANYLTIDKKINDSDLIERLSKDNKDIINKTKEKVEKDEGITFQPDIGDNEYNQNINTTFMERNELFINKKNNFIEQENAKQIENLRNGTNKKKKYTSEEREQIINNIIERLYKKGLEQKNKNEKTESGEDDDNEEDNNEEDNNEEEEQVEE